MAWELTLANGYRLSDDRARLDVGMLHRYLSEECYWAIGRSLETVERSIAHSLCLGLYAPDGTQAGFARAMTDYAVRAHLVDVFVRPEHRGKGLGKTLVGAILAHPDLDGVQAWTLSTRDAHAFYAGFGFGGLTEPQQQMMWRRRRPA